ncbi:MAG: hypothetical protein M5U34_17345 [Chloroflexi bacterium]|nr:hypothetical protein [Chloroflexota bacterium]
MGRYWDALLIATPWIRLTVTPGWVPMLARHIVGKRPFLTGRSNPIQAIPLIRSPRGSRLLFSTEAMNVSGALLPMLLSPENAAERRVKLRRLARRMWQTPLPETETAVQTFARIQQKLNPQIMRLPAGKLYTNRNIPAVTGSPSCLAYKPCTKIRKHRHGAGKYVRARYFTHRLGADDRPPDRRM